MHLTRLFALASLLSLVGCAAATGSGRSAEAGLADATPAPLDGVGETDASEPPRTPWVEIRSPLGGEVPNPVTFEIAAGGDVAIVQLRADEWPLHDEPLPASARVHTYSFSGVGYERLIVLTGLDNEGREVASDEVRITPVNPAPDLAFPIALDEATLFLSNFDSSASTGAFRASRSGGRLHAGCDLYWTNDDGNAYRNGYYPLNDNKAVYAIADGTITAYDSFYLGTHEVVIDHGDFIVRYGEVDDGGLTGGLGVGSPVTAGQQIGTMGDLDIGSGWAMLHLELYSGERSGSLTQRSNPSYLYVPDGNFQRRGDLMDCTPFLLGILEGSGF
jgi:hypothetical protein